mmetsp:Transcript_24364/g.56617  ORF Transcript_24364/g.56617 Transcript_24364/m.56617 type:complete len:428 (-) Transcript_24364:1666-2949(-)
MTEPASAQEVIWGEVQLPRRSNVLAGAVQVPDGESLTAAFLLFDASTRQVLLCRYVAGSLARTRARPLQPLTAVEHKSLQSPRQLLLCSRMSVFASLDVQAGISTVALWYVETSQQAGRAASERKDDAKPEEGMGYCLAADVDLEGIKTARAVAWLDAEVPYWALSEAGAAASGVSCGAVLAVLTAKEVLVLLVHGAASASSLTVQMVLRLRVDFKATCLCWSSDGRQLLLGGQGQMLCYSWTARPETGTSVQPLTQQFLCSGDCVSISSLYTDSFLCSLEQKSQTSSLHQVADLALPNGATIQTPANTRNMVIEVNPQDGESLAPSEPTLQGSTVSSLLSAPSIAGSSASALQVVPTRRYILPLKNELASAGGRPRLRCGPELEVDGEMVSVCVGISSGRPTSAAVAVASYDRPSVKVPVCDSHRR